MSWTFTQIIFILAVISNVCIAAPAVSTNNVATSYLQLLARDEGSAAAATPNIIFPDNAQLKFSLAAEGTQVKAQLCYKNITESYVY